MKLVCEANAHNTNCGSSCPLTCTRQSREGIICTDQCVSGCFCDEDRGYVRDETTNQCVLKESCPVCQANAHYRDCGSSCPLTCNRPSREGIACTDQCVRGCFCNEDR